ncbi:PAS domain-containing protein [Ideonella sp.]|uniref:PAS domain-containing protein n=1 Tax=Ideonella sp. TaxID=1929293 RepID=UPI0035AF8BE4
MPGSPSPVAQRHALTSALQIGLVYLAVGALWIWLSDAAVAGLSDDPAWREAAQRYKGLVYILVTTLGLMYLVHRSHRQLIDAQERAARTELRVADLFERHPQPMWLQDAETARFLRVNDAAVKAYGYSREELLCMATRDIWPEADVPSHPGEFDTPTLGALARGVSRHRTKDGRLLLARLTEHPLDFNGRAALLVMAEDVTQEGLLVQALRHQLQAQQQVKQCLGVVLWVGTPDRRQLSHVSTSLLELAGCPPAQLMADPASWRRLIHPDDRARVPALLAEVDRHADAPATALRWEYRIVRPDGGVRWVEDRRCERHDDSGRLTLVGGMWRDITDRRGPG